MSHDDEKKRLLTEDALQGFNPELEDRVAAHTADLETRNKELEAFSYSVAHDLRAPLRHMQGFVDLLKRRLEKHHDQEALQYATKIAMASKQMNKLIDDLLDCSCTGHREMQKGNVNLNAIFKGVVWEIREGLKGREIKWKIDELPDVFGDKSLLRLVIVNLVSNAVKFTCNCPQAEIKIGCNVGKKEFTYFIKDNGVGFDMGHIDRLFGVFQRLHAQEEFEGTGIGLANVRRIISRHGGRVWAEGAVGHGATFYFTLPTIKGHEHAGS